MEESELRKRLERDIGSDVTDSEWETIRRMNLLEEYREELENESGSNKKALDNFVGGAHITLSSIRTHQEVSGAEAGNAGDKAPRIQQKRPSFSKSGANRTLPAAHTGAGESGLRGWDRMEAVDEYNRQLVGGRGTRTSSHVGSTVVALGGDEGTLPQYVCFMGFDLRCSPDEVRDHYVSLRESCRRAVDLKGNTEDVLVCPVNTDGTAQGEIAREFKRIFPDNFGRYSEACKNGEVEVGKVLVVGIKGSNKPRYVVYLPVRARFGDLPCIEYIREGIENLKKTVGQLRVKSIYIPEIACEYGELDWGKEVKPLLLNEIGGKNLPGVAVGIGKKRERSLDASTFAVAAFVWSVRRGHRERQQGIDRSSNWGEIRKAWNEAYPDGKQYHSVQTFRDAVRSAEEDIEAFDRSINDDLKSFARRGGGKEAFAAWGNRILETL